MSDDCRALNGEKTVLLFYLITDIQQTVCLSAQFLLYSLLTYLEPYVRITATIGEKWSEVKITASLGTLRKNSRISRMIFLE